jgi:7,8-dihydroneopterin aldolase/epimerase/oxygenase
MRPGDLDAITLSGMRFHILIGILPHEREHPQPIEIDLTAWVNAGDGIVDYRELYSGVRAAMEGTQRYLEDIANAIAARCLSEKGVERVRVAVRKPHVSLGGPLNFAEIVVVRLRDA